MTGCLRTVGTAVAEAEASLPTVRERHMRKALRVWAGLYGMPETHPLVRLIRRRMYKMFASPMQKMAGYAKIASLKELEAA